MKFKEMKAGDTAEMEFLLTGVSENRTKASGGLQKVYCDIEVSDGESKQTVKVWDRSKKVFEPVLRHVLKAAVTAKEYRGNITFTAKDISVLKNADISSYRIETSLDRKEAWNRLTELVLGSKSEPADEVSYADVAFSLLNDWKDKFMCWAASQKVHHNYYGGLLEHTLSVVEKCADDADRCPFLNRELLICGAAVHDIGKVEELATDELGTAVYTMAGNLEGHINIGAQMVLEKSRMMGLDLEKTSLLRHMILSHHGRPEFGSNVRPSVPEAFVLFLNDYKDAKLKAYEDIIAGIEPGTIAGSSSWILDGVHVYKETGSAL